MLVVSFFENGANLNNPACFAIRKCTENGIRAHKNFHISRRERT